MDKSALTQAMKASISEVLEQMFFLPIDFIAPEKASADPAPEETSIMAKLGFCGSCGGTFLLRIPLALARSISADFLGTEPQSLSADQVTATVLEMVNMLAGSTLSNYDHQALFDLQIPELITIDDVGALTQAVADHIVIRIQTPENRMMFELIIQ
jgi:CheY-specific phosphatase CheX